MACISCQHAATTSDSVRCFITRRDPKRKETFRWGRYKRIVRKISAKGFEKKKRRTIRGASKKGIRQGGVKNKIRAVK